MYFSAKMKCNSVFYGVYVHVCVHLGIVFLLND